MDHIASCPFERNPLSVWPRPKSIALFFRVLQIRQQPRINRLREPVQLRPTHNLLTPIPRPRCKRAHLVNRSARQTKITRNRPLAASLIKMRTPHLQINFHSVNPPTLHAQTVRTKKVDDFCAARTGEIPALL